MKISLTALMVAASAFAAGSGVISCLGKFRPFGISGNSFASSHIQSVLHALDLTFCLRTTGLFGDAAIQEPAGGTSQEKLAFPSLPTLSEIHSLIRNAANKYRIPPAFVKSIVAAESNFNSEVVSLKGAVGLMQLMPETAREYGADPTVPEQNIEAGTHYLSFLMQKYRRSSSPLRNTIAAYNAGPAAVDHYRGVPPFRETRGYVLRVLAFFRHFQNEPV